MTNPYYNGGSFPATGSPATSASMRAELSSISAGFDKLPTLSGNASKLVVVDGSASALEATNVLPAVTITDSNFVVEDNADSTRKFRFEASSVSAGATRVLTVPDANLTLVGEATTQTLTNKTFGDNPTLSAGTANGVLYLNGSKVATSGSALVFDGTNFTTTGYAAGNGLRSLGGNAVRFYNAANANWSQISAPAGTGDMQFDTGAGEQMRLTSTGLGIGTSSPATKLHVNTGVAGYGITVAALSQTSRTYQFGIDSNSNFAIYESVAATQRVVLDQSGNLGLGVTPSAWQSVYKAIDVGNSLSLIGGSNAGDLYYNAYINSSGGFVYRATTTASAYSLAGGQHRWYTAPSGTAGNAISFTQAMTLDGSGNLLVGTTTTTNNLRLQQKLALVSTGNGSYAGMAITGYAGTDATARPVFDFNRSRGTTDGSMTVVANNDLLGSIVFRGADGSSFRDAAAISAFVNGTPGASDMPGGLIFETTPDGSATLQERARITSGGYFKASNTGTYVSSTSSYHEFNGDATICLVGYGRKASAGGVVITADTLTANAYTYLYTGSNGGTDTFRVAANGNVTNTNGSYGTISDARMKTDIVDAGSQWADIKAVRFRKFKMKDDPTGLVQLGVVAQEIEQTSPGLVLEQPDLDADGNPTSTTTKSVKTSVLLMKAAVALQEAMARIEKLESTVTALTARVAALEAQP